MILGLRNAALAALAGCALICAAGEANATGRNRPSPVSFSAQSYDAPTPWVAEAGRWVGAHNPTGTIGPWCADFVSFVLRRTGHAPLANRMAASALAYGPQVSFPKPGDLAVIRTNRGPYGHIGIVEGIERDGSIDLVSGNWGNRVAHSRISRHAVTAFVEVR